MKDHVELLVQVPKPLLDFISAYLRFCGVNESAEDYLKRELEEHAKVFVKNSLIEPLENSEEMMERYGLKKS